MRSSINLLFFILISGNRHTTRRFRICVRAESRIRTDNHLITNQARYRCAISAYSVGDNFFLTENLLKKGVLTVYLVCIALTYVCAVLVRADTSGTLRVYSYWRGATVVLVNSKAHKRVILFNDVAARQWQRYLDSNQGCRSQIPVPFATWRYRYMVIPRGFEPLTPP